MQIASLHMNYLATNNIKLYRTSGGAPEYSVSVCCAVQWLITSTDPPDFHFTPRMSDPVLCYAIARTQKQYMPQHLNDVQEQQAAPSSLPILGRRAKTKVVSFVVEKERKAEAYGRRLSLGGTHQELQLRNVLMLYVLQFYAVAFTTFVIYCICISPFNMPSKFNIRRVGCSASVFCLALLGLLIILVACRYGMGWSLCVTKRQRLVSSLVSLEISSTLSLEGYQRD